MKRIIAKTLWRLGGLFIKGWNEFHQSRDCFYILNVSLLIVTEITRRKIVFWKTKLRHKTKSKTTCWGNGPRNAEIMPNRHILTVGVPELGDKCHFRWSVRIFFGKIQVSFEQASLARENRNKLKLKLRRRLIEMILLYVAITTLILWNKLTRRCPGVQLPLVPIWKDFRRLSGQPKTRPHHSCWDL